MNPLQSCREAVKRLAAIAASRTILYERGKRRQWVPRKRRFNPLFWIHAGMMLLLLLSIVGPPVD